MSKVLSVGVDWGSVLVPDEGAEYLDRWFYAQVRAARGSVRRPDGRVLPILGGGAEIFPDEGLDYLIARTFQSPGGGSPPAGNQWTAAPHLGLFVNGGSVSGPTTVPARTAVLATPSGITEASGGGYLRASIPSTSWPAPATNGSGRRSTVAAPGVEFAESSGSYSDPNVQGFFFATASTGGVAIFYANFDSGATIVVNQAGFVVRIPPYVQLDG